MQITKAFVAVAAAALGLALVTGCTSTGPTEPTGSPSPDARTSPSAAAGAVATDVAATPAPDDASSASRPASVPTTCTDVVAPDVAAELAEQSSLTALVPQDSTVAPFFDSTTAQSITDGVSLACHWGEPDAEIVGLNVTFSPVSAETSSAYTDELAALGWTCSDRHAGRHCQLIPTPESMEPYYTVDAAQTAFARDGLVVTVRQYDYPTDDLIGSIVDHVWG